MSHSVTLLQTWEGRGSQVTKEIWFGCQIRAHCNQLRFKSNFVTFRKINTSSKLTKRYFYQQDWGLCIPQAHSIQCYSSEIKLWWCQAKTWTKTQEQFPLFVASPQIRDLIPCPTPLLQHCGTFKVLWTPLFILRQKVKSIHFTEFAHETLIENFLLCVPNCSANIMIL